MKTRNFIVQAGSERETTKMARSRNLIIGCDGTWNDTDESALTNVAKILNACVSKDQVV